MTNQRSSSNQNARAIEEEIASYFGLIVSVVVRMENRSLIRYRDREFIVETEDLQKCLMAERAAA